jgi:hypothetical protein
MNVPILDTAGVAKAIKEGFNIDYDRVLQFVHYLRFEFYSFGNQIQRRVRYEDGSPITATTEIKYYELRGFTPQTLLIDRAPKPISRMSPLFDRYRSNAQGKEWQTAKSISVVNKIGASKALTPSRGRRRLPKLAKLQRDPQAFFRDSHIGLLRPLRHLFAPKATAPSDV